MSKRKKVNLSPIPLKKRRTTMGNNGDTIVLECIGNPLKPEYTVFLLNKSKIKIGRDPVACDVVLNTVMVSREHCVIYKQNNQWSIQDLKSTNGISVNSVKIGKNKNFMSRIENNDILLFGLYIC